jgi:tRNA(His) 5'-end guanylyltransferase
MHTNLIDICRFLIYSFYFLRSQNEHQTRKNEAYLGSVRGNQRDSTLFEERGKNLQFSAELGGKERPEGQERQGW